MKTLYEANWHYSNDTLVRISVSPIKVLREGILPGCSAVSITAVDKDGHQFQGCPQDYFETEEAAWKQATIELQEAIASEQRGICEAQRRIEGLRSVLSAIQEDEPAEVPQDAISVVGMPEFDALMDYIYEEGTSGEAVIRLANKLVRVAIQSHITHARNAQPAPDVKALVEALEWYEQQAAGCRKLTSEGDDCRQALDSDGGKRAQTALAAHRQAQRQA